MRKIIYHIRKQPEEIKRHILHLLTMVCAIILISLWIYSLGKNLDNVTTDVKENTDLRPLSALKGNMIEGYHNIVNGSISDTEE